MSFRNQVPILSRHRLKVSCLIGSVLPGPGNKTGAKSRRQVIIMPATKQMRSGLSVSASALRGYASGLDL